MKRNWGSLALLLTAMLFVGCRGLTVTGVTGSGNVVDKEFEIGDFSALDFGAWGDMTVVYGEETSLRVTGEDNLLEFFEVRVVDNELQIGTERNVGFVPSEPIRWVLTVKELEAITLSGLGDVSVPELHGEHINLTIDGAGSLEVDGVEADVLEASIDGLGGITILGGRVEDQLVNLDGAGSYKAQNVESSNAAVSVTGTGTASIWATDELSARVTGLGNVDYIGEPDVDSEVTGVGRVNRLDK